jgi:hypothetical protein
VFGLVFWTGLASWAGKYLGAMQSQSGEILLSFRDIRVLVPVLLRAKSDAWK